jgi:hypothetical protein
MNIKLSYLYRDASNYKRFNEVVFRNPNAITFDEIHSIIRSKLIDGCWFVAKDWNLPDMHFQEYEWNNEVDHEWHELELIEETKDPVTLQTPIDDFLKTITSKEGLFF